MLSILPEEEAQAYANMHTFLHHGTACQLVLDRNKCQMTRSHYVSAFFPRQAKHRLPAERFAGFILRDELCLWRYKRKGAHLAWYSLRCAHGVLR